ncbi:MAG: hypothetical protein HC856_00660 [Pseudanabaena sp. RU_4_16]|nr:hypothetical protein [Pseudanabaena sp. RU_4_16]
MYLKSLLRHSVPRKFKEHLPCRVTLVPGASFSLLWDRVCRSPWATWIRAAGQPISILGEQGVGKLLVLSQVVLSLQLPFAIVPLIMFTDSVKLMGQFANSR